MKTTYKFILFRAGTAWMLTDQPPTRGAAFSAARDYHARWGRIEVFRRSQRGAQVKLEMIGATV